MRTNRTRTRVICAGIASCAFFGGAEIATAQVRLLPRASRPDTTENYVLQVANDQQIAITRIELRFPHSVKLLSLGERSDWPVQSLAPGPRVSAAVWTGVLSPGRFTEFGFIARNPPATVLLMWPAIVTFANGERVLWWTDPRSATKAPTTLISAPRGRGNLAVALGVCLIALLLALSALVVALRSGSGGGHTGFRPGVG